MSRKPIPTWFFVLDASSDRRPYVVPGDARRSPLSALLASGEGDCAAHEELSDDERRSIFAWIDLGARWDGSGPGSNASTSRISEE